MTTELTIYYWNPVKQEIADIETIRGYHPNASIPEKADISVLGWFPLVETESPDYNKLTQVLTWVVEQKQSHQGPYFYRSYKVGNLPPEKIAENTAVFLEQQKKSFIETAQKLLDDFARSRGYDDIKSAIGYLQSSIPQFKQEAEICLEKRDQMWYALFNILDRVQNQEIEVPMDFSDIVSQLPILEWN